MVKLIKTIFLFLLLLFLAFLVGTTFFGASSSTITYNLSQKISEDMQGYYSFSTWAILSEVADTADRNDIYMQNISRFADIYALENTDFDAYSIDEENSIALWKWRYVIDVSNPTQWYTVTSPGLSIETLSPGRFYVDTRDISNITVLSLGATLELTFLDKASQEYITNAYIFPNRYISFNTLRNNELRNADFLRISQVVSRYGYLNETLLQSDGTLGLKLSRLLWDSGQQFLTPIFSKIRSDIENNTQAYKELTSFNIWSFPWLEYIRERFLFFKNNTKKIVFYKNIILADIDSVFRDDDGKKHITDIKNNLDILESLSEQEYVFMKHLINYYAYIVQWNHDDISDTIKKNFTQLLATISTDSNDEKQYYSLQKLNTMYLKYNFYDDTTQLSDMSLFIDTFFQDLGVQKDENSITDIVHQTSITDYFSAYLQSLLTQILLSHISSDKTMSNETLAWALAIINENISLWEYIYFTQNNVSNSRKQTGLYQNLDFLIILEKFLKNNLFLSERNSRNLLVPKTDVWVRESIIRLNENTDNMFSLYTQHQAVAGANANKLKAYNIIKNKLYEYFIAIKSYDRYTQEFDTVVSTTGDTQVYQADGDDGVSEKAFLEYISQFDGVNLAGVNVEVIQWEYYRVSNVIISGSRMDFELYPFKGNTLESITVDFKSVNGSYRLDERELDLEEKFKIARGDDRDKYDFKRFFINTFFTEKINDAGPEFIDTTDTPVESKSIQTFKKSKLLWDWNEFSFVDTYLPLQWEQVVVTQSSDSYDIEIVDALYVSQETRTQYHASFHSEYEFTSTTHRFENIEIGLYEKYSSGKTRKLWLGWNKISFIGNVHIADFNTVSEKFFYQIGLLQSVYNTVSRELNMSDMKIFYYPSNDQIKINFVYNGNAISLTLGNEQILFLKNNGKTVANQLKTSTLPSALEQIK